MTFKVSIGVHGDKTRVLQKTRVDTATRARKIRWHSVDHIIFKPTETFVHCQVVDSGRRLGGINRATHHGHAQGQMFSTTGHQRHRSQHRHSGLANTHHMAMAMGSLYMTNKFLNVVDIVVKMKFTLCQGYKSGIFPIGDVNLVSLQHGFHCVAQQSGVMT